MARKPIPAYCEGNPNLYLMCKKDKDSMVVALFNCFEDSVLDGEIVLDDTYSKIEFFGCDGVFEGNKVALTEAIGAFNSVAFKVVR